MVCDRFVEFDAAPSDADLRAFLDVYLGGVGEVAWQDDRWCVTLPGTPTDVTGWRTADLPAERWFEVFRHPDAVNVMTRRADRFTAALADDVAALVAAYWAGHARRAAPLRRRRHHADRRIFAARRPSP